MSFGTFPFGTAPFGIEAVVITSVVDTATSADSITPDYMSGVIERLYAKDIITTLHFTNIIEQLNVTDSLDAALVYGLVDRLYAVSTLIPQAAYVLNVLDTSNTTDRAIESAYFDVHENLAAEASIVATRAALAAINDVVFAQAATTSAYTYGFSLVDAAVATAAIATTQALNITDVAIAQATLANHISYFLALSETVNISDTVVNSARFTILLDDTAEPVDTLVSATSFFATIEESLTATFTLDIAGQAYTAIVMNAVNKAVTEYAPYDFNSLAFFNGETYGANALGLFKLSGSTDNGALINAYARTALSRIASGKQAQVDSAYLGYSSDGTMQLKTIITEPDGSKVARVYQLNTQNADASRSGRIKLGRGVKSAYWAFEISNVLGADFTIDVVEMHVLALSRRI